MRPRQPLFAPTPGPLPTPTVLRWSSPGSTGSKVPPALTWIASSFLFALLLISEKKFLGGVIALYLKDFYTMEGVNVLASGAAIKSSQSGSPKHPAL